jgi:ribonuclease VapC
MVIDSSAMLAILLDEPERSGFIAAIEKDATRAMSLVSFVECSLVLDVRCGPDAVRDLDLFIARAQVSLVPVESDPAHVARQAHRRFGKGRHAAGLNLGDCFAYALARTMAEPLLFKGATFALTDVDPAIAAAAP